MADEPARETPAEESPAEESPAEEAPWQRRRRLAAVFGDVLPETTQDEREAQGPSDDTQDRWLRNEVPPHHG